MNIQKYKGSYLSAFTMIGVRIAFSYEKHFLRYKIRSETY